MHSSEAVPTGCQLRLHGGVGRAALIPTVEKSRVTRSEAVGPGPGKSAATCGVRGAEAG